jgi:hypothetical protein
VLDQILLELGANLIAHRLLRGIVAPAVALE